MEKGQGKARWILPRTPYLESGTPRTLRWCAETLAGARFPGGDK